MSNMTTAKQFVNGIRVYAPNEKAPEWVILNMTFNKAELLSFLSNQPADFKVNLLKSQKGTLYLAVDNYGAGERVNKEAQEGNKPLTNEEKLKKAQEIYNDEMENDTAGESLPF